MYKVLIVDDEIRMQDLLCLYLEPEGYVSETAGNADQALSLLQINQYDLMLLDIMMPGMDGFEFCKQIREQFDIPIIMITARSTVSDMIKGLQLGGDDYIVKPFDQQVLLARMEAVIRRHKKVHDSQQTIKHYGNGLAVDMKAMQIFYGDTEISLTPKEFDLISILMQNPRRVYKREKLMELIWGFDSETEDRTIDSHIRNIRDKFRKSGFPIDEYLKTIWGVGYRWEKEV